MPAACLFLSGDLMFGSRIRAAADSAKVSLTTVSGADDAVARCAAEPFALVIVDLGLPGLAIESLVSRLKALSPSPAVLAYGPHVHAARLAAATAAGCDEVLTRGQFDTQLGSILARFAAQ